MKCLQNVRSLVFRWAFTQTILARAAKETIGGSTGDDDDDDDNYDQDDDSVTCDVKKWLSYAFELLNLQIIFSVKIVAPSSQGLEAG